MTVELHVEEVGEGLPVVLLHAFPLTSAMWVHQRPELGSVCRLITPDLRGFGGSPPGDGEPSLDAAADDVAAALDARGIERAVVGGLSMGGYVTMAFLRRHGERARAVVLADTKAGTDPPAARTNRLRIADTVLAEDSPRVLLDEVLPSVLGRTTLAERPAVCREVRGLAAAAPPGAAAWAQRAMAARPDSFETLRALGVPALVIVGEEDVPSPPGEAEAMAAAISGARLVRIPRAGHLSSVEAPPLFNAAVRDFLARL